jgi:hypothetical protein
MLFAVCCDTLEALGTGPGSDYISRGRGKKRRQTARPYAVFVVCWSWASVADGQGAAARIVA